MPKGQDANKTNKKPAAKTLKEKRKRKKEKKIQAKAGSS